jgi:prepilin-type N-terminal cleavage/methylation domain-containing protein
MKSRIQSQRGITFVELMASVLIIGVVAAMATPQMQKTYERLEFRAHVKDMTSTLKLARSMAITSKEQFGVYFDPNQRTVTLFKDIQNPSNYDFVSGDSVIRVDTLPRQFVYLGSDVTNSVIAFKPNGSAGFTGPGNVYSISLDAKIVGIQQTNVLAATGRVHTEYWIY